MTSLAAVNAGILIGWSDRHWPCWARLASPRALTPEWSTTLGTGLGGPACCEVLWHQGEPAVAYTDRDGVHLQLGEPGSGERRSRLLGGRAPFAVASGAGGLVVAFADAGGIRLGRLDHEPIPVVSRRDVVALTLTRCRGSYLLVAGLERSLEVVALDAELRETHHVRHPLEAPLRTLRAAEAGGRVALAIAYDAPRADRIDTALLDGTGAMRERPHTIFRGAYANPTIHWDEHGFRLSGRDPGGAVISRRIGPKWEPQVLFEDVERPFGIVHQYGRTLLAAVDGCALDLRVRGDAEMTRPSAIDLTPDDAALQRHTDSARAVGAAWERLRSRGGYRGDAGMRWDPTTLEASFPPSGDSRGLRMKLVHSASGVRLVVVLGEPGVDAPTASWARMVRWLKRRVSKRDREAHERACALAQPIAGDPLPDDARIEALGDTVLLELPLPELPTPETLDHWSRTLLDRVPKLRRGVD